MSWPVQGDGIQPLLSVSPLKPQNSIPLKVPAEALSGSSLYKPEQGPHLFERDGTKLKENILKETLDCSSLIEQSYKWNQSSSNCF